MSEKIAISDLGPREFRSPLRLDALGSIESTFIHDGMYYRHPFESDGQLFERAGPREHLFFEPAKTKVAIVTCGGLCPGLNNVIRSVYVQLHYHYGVPAVMGVRYGYSGFSSETSKAPMWLNAEIVNNIHQFGGTLLGTSRGPVSADIIVDFLEQRGINVLFTVGRRRHPTRRARRGHGNPAAQAEDLDDWNSQDHRRRCAVCEPLVRLLHGDREGQGRHRLSPRGSALRAQRHQHREGDGTRLGLHRRRRDAGQPGSQLHPGSRGAVSSWRARADCWPLLHRRLLERRHAVIVVAEGAGQHLMPPAEKRDASGNLLHRDIGTFLRDKIRDHFQTQRFPVVIRYFDPSYYIRSVPASTVDSVLCDSFARHAVHAAMAGKTDMIVGLQHGAFIHVPIPMATTQRKRLSSEEWASVVTATGQPDLG